MAGGRVGAPLGCESEDTDIGATLVASQDTIAVVLFGSLVGWKALDDELQYSDVDSGGVNLVEDHLLGLEGDRAR